MWLNLQILIKMKWIYQIIRAFIKNKDLCQRILNKNKINNKINNNNNHNNRQINNLNPRCKLRMKKNN